MKTFIHSLWLASIISLGSAQAAVSVSSEFQAPRTADWERLKGKAALFGSEPSSLESYFLTLLEKKSCYPSFQQYVSCVEALGTIGSIVEGLVLYPDFYEFRGWDAYYTRSETTTRSFNRYRWVKQKWKFKAVIPPQLKNALVQKDLDQRMSSIRMIFLLDQTLKSIDFAEEARLLLVKVEDPAKRREIVIYGATEAIKYGLGDPHVWLKDAKEFDAVVSSSASEWVGLGISSLGEAEGVRVAGVEKGASADQMGMHEGDLIVSVNGKSLADCGGDPGELQELLKGKEGESVSIKVQRGKRFLSLAGTYQKLVAPHVVSRRLDKTKVVHLSLKTFAYAHACTELEAAIDREEKAGPVDGWILDLRGNPGGQLPQAACIAGLFLKPDLLVTRVTDLDGQEIERYFTRREKPRVEQRLVILVNEGSASASELLSSALRDHRRALIVGQRSFGKGCGQNVQFVEQLGVYAARTTFYFERPSGGSVQRVGVNPDFSVVRGYAPYDFIQKGRLFGEEDFFPSSLPNRTGEGRVPEFPGMKEIQSCVAKFDSKRWYDQNLGQTHLPDLQLRMAQEVLECQMKK